MSDWVEITESQNKFLWWVHENHFNELSDGNRNVLNNVLGVDVNGSVTVFIGKYIRRGLRRDTLNSLRDRYLEEYKIWKQHT